MRWKGVGRGHPDNGWKIENCNELIMPFRDGRTENVGTFVFDHPTCGEKVGDYTQKQDEIRTSSRHIVAFAHQGTVILQRKTSKCTSKMMSLICPKKYYGMFDKKECKKCKYWSIIDHYLHLWMHLLDTNNEYCSWGISQ